MMGRWTSRSVLTLGIVLVVVSVAHAQATRTWVSGVGDDANPCSRTAPCKTFAGAISKTADGGFINVLDSGGFGAVTITKSITIDGEGAHAGVLASATNAITVNGSGKRVTLRNLALESPISPSTPGLIGIRVLAAAEVHVENVFISGFGTGISFNPSGGGEGHFNNVSLINNSAAGILVTSGRAMVNKLWAQSNANGLLVNGTAIAVIRDSYAAGGTQGFGVIASTAVLNIENCTLTHNSSAIFATTSGTVRVSDSMIVSNTDTGLFNDGSATIISLGGNELTGNPNNGNFSSTLGKQ